MNTNIITQKGSSLIILISFILMLFFSVNAFAGGAKRILVVHDEDGTGEIWEDEHGHLWIVWIDKKDGHIYLSELDRGSDSENEIRKPSKRELEDLIRRSTSSGQYKFWQRVNNPLASIQQAHGHGLKPIWNPPNVRPAPGSNGPQHPGPSSLKDKIRRGAKKNNNSSKNKTPKMSSMPDTNEMGSKNDHVAPEKINPVPIFRLR